MTKPSAADVARTTACVGALVSEMRRVCNGQDSRAVLIALEEMYARVLSDCVHQPEGMESWLSTFQEHVRGWWVADRGGPFRPA